MVTVNTDLGTLRESARRARVEEVGGITTNNVQLALQALDTGKIGSYTGPTSVTTATYTVLTTDVEIFVNRADVVAIALPDAATWLAANKNGLPLTVKDVGGNAGANTITINAAGADTIDSAASLTITTNFGGWKLRPRSGGNWTIVG